jgi:hypothetical protein
MYSAIAFYKKVPDITPDNHIELFHWNELPPPTPWDCIASPIFQFNCSRCMGKFKSQQNRVCHWKKPFQIVLQIQREQTFDPEEPWKFSFKTTSGEGNFRRPGFGDPDSASTKVTCKNCQVGLFPPKLKKVLMLTFKRLHIWPTDLQNVILNYLVEPKPPMDQLCRKCITEQDPLDFPLSP